MPYLCHKFYAILLSMRLFYVLIATFFVIASYGAQANSLQCVEMMTDSHVEMSAQMDCPDMQAMDHDADMNKGDACCDNCNCVDIGTVQSYIPAPLLQTASITVKSILEQNLVSAPSSFIYPIPLGPPKLTA